MPETVFYKAAVGPEGELALVPNDQTPYATLGAAVFSVAEVRNLDLMDCRPVIVSVVRAYMVREEVVEIQS